MYSPVLVVALAGLVLGLRRPERGLFAFLAAGVLATLVLLAKFGVWWGGHSFGPRLLADVLPLLAVLATPAWPRLASARAGRVALAALLAWSVAVQAVGVLCYPSPREVDWNTTPRDVDQAPERLWDWRDPQLLRLLRNGPRPPGFAG